MYSFYKKSRSDARGKWDSKKVIKYESRVKRDLKAIKEFG